MQMLHCHTLPHGVSLKQPNKTDVFHFPSRNVKLIKEDGKVFIAKQSTDIVTSNDISEDQKCWLSPCSHEEADTRLILHCFGMAQMNHRDVMFTTSNTDVVILATAHYLSLNSDMLWITFGIGAHFKFPPAHEFATGLVPEKATTSLKFHALISCNTVSSVSKKTCWDMWMCDPEFTRVFLKMLTSPETLSYIFLEV